MNNSQHDIEALAESAEPGRRRRSLELMREAIAGGQDPAAFFDLARKLIGDEDNDCRWQAAIVVGESIESNAEGVWEVICEFAEWQDEDMRDAISAILLEHLLEHHFERFFDPVKAKVEAGSLMFADTLRRCWAFGEAESKWFQVEALLRAAESKRDGSPP